MHGICFGRNEEPAWKLTKNNECDVTYVLKEPRRRSTCVIHKAWHFPLLCRRRRHQLCISAAYRISSSGSSLKTHWNKHVVANMMDVVCVQIVIWGENIKNIMLVYKPRQMYAMRTQLPRFPGYRLSMALAEAAKEFTLASLRLFARSSVY
jgi:hypothetical protein